MAIEVLKRGKKKQDKTYTTMCTNCRSKLRFLHSDAKSVYDWREHEDLLEIACPVCQQRVFVKE